MKRKVPTKIKTIGKRKESKQVLFEIPEFHESFPFTLFHKQDKEKKVCYFQCKEHMNSYIKRGKLTDKDIRIEKTSVKENSDTV
jgi:hypothetical protein